MYQEYKRGRPTRIQNFRVTSDEKTILKKEAEKQELSVADLLREWLQPKIKEAAKNQEAA